MTEARYVHSGILHAVLCTFIRVNVYHWQDAEGYNGGSGGRATLGRERLLSLRISTKSDVPTLKMFLIGVYGGVEYAGG